MSLYPCFLLTCCVLYVTAFPEPAWYSDSRPSFNKPTPHPGFEPLINRPTFNPNQSTRFRRFTDGSQRFDRQNPQQEKRPDWEIKPDLSRDQSGNTKGRVTIENHGENHDLEAGWGQTIRGPDKHSETWHVGGSIRW